MVANLRRRPHPVRLKWVKGHKGHELNEGADCLAGQGTRKNNTDNIPLDADRRLTLTGAKLTAVTQKLAYKGIREQKLRSLSQRTCTQDNTICAIDNIEVFFGETPSEVQLWRGIQHKDIR